MNKEDISVRGIILRESETGESDKIITLLTDELGKLTVSCKGVRTLKSRRFAAIQMFSYDELLLTRTNGKYYLKEAGVIESFFGLRMSIEAVALANYFADVISAVTVEGQSEPELLRLILNSLFVLAQNEKQPEIIKATFEMRCACESGFTPDLSVCSECGCDDANKLFLDVINGVLKCGDCIFGNNVLGGESGLLLPLGENSLSALRYIVSAHPKRIFAPAYDSKTSGELRSICEKYLLNHLERGFDTLTYYKSVL